MTATPDGYRLDDEMFGDRLSVAQEWQRRVALISDVVEEQRYGWMTSVGAGAG
jgi:hypothetical protein